MMRCWSGVAGVGRLCPNAHGFDPSGPAKAPAPRTAAPLSNRRRVTDPLLAGFVSGTFSDLSCRPIVVSFPRRPPSFGGHDPTILGDRRKRKMAGETPHRKYPAARSRERWGLRRP